MSQRPKKNQSGKTLTVFAIIIAFLLLSITATAIFYFQKERRERQALALELNKTMAEIGSFENQIKKINKEKFLLEERHKEADEKINSLLDELDLEAGIRDEIKKENVTLRKDLERATLEIDRLKAQIAAIPPSVGSAAELEKTLQAEREIYAALEQKYAQLEAENGRLEKYVEQLQQGLATIQDSSALPEVEDPRESVAAALEKISVAPKDIPEGRILSVDKDTEFVIINLGTKDGVNTGSIMSVYRGKDYLGDVKVTRVQPEMAAADLIPPFSSRLVRKNDQVVIKQ